ncbi:MAG TPA: RNA methyltransferase [Helicobacteraceae bacterium]|nr:RNA methyltransferase [Helicobacteraceae bacterium]
MTLIPIEDIHLSELKIYHQLRDNAFSHDNSFIADSPKVVNKLLERDITVKSILATQEYYDAFEARLIKHADAKFYVAAKHVMEEIVGHKIHHNVMMHGVRPECVALESLDDKIIMLDEISSTENIGSIGRSAAALGVNSYLLPQQGPHPFGRRALRVSMGYMSHLKTHLYEDIFDTIAQLKSMGYTIFAAEVIENSIPLAHVTVPQKWVLLMGHEGKGISKEILQACDNVVAIEMAPGVKSFNVSVAAAIMMYQFINH